MLAFVASFALGAGPVTWMYVGEILPPEARGAAGSLATAINWGLNACVAGAFPSAVAAVGLVPVYAFFAACNVAAVCFGAAAMLETKQLHLDVVHRRLTGR